jgi:hypothetical protein
VGNLNSPVVVLIGDQNVAVLQQLCAVGVVELIRSIPSNACDTVWLDDLLPPVHLDDLLIPLVGNQDMAGRQPGVLDGVLSSFASEPLTPN